MSNFTLKQDGFSSYTAISNCFIEQYMPYAAGEFVKIYIYLLKCVSQNRSELSISKIADVFNNTEKDVVRAMKYWQKKGLLRLSFDEDGSLSSLHIISLPDQSTVQELPIQEHVTLDITDAPVPGQPGINVKHSRPVPETPAAVPVSEETAGAVQLPAKKEYSNQEIQDFSSREEIRQLFYIIQKYLGRPLTGQDTDTVLYLYDTLGFSEELIEYLFEYCVSRNHRSIRYIEKTALAWAEEGIKTVQGAKAVAGIYSEDCYQVLNAFGLNNRRPTRNESAYVSKWTLSYGFDIQMILKACERTMNQLHQPSFEYTDAILKNWKSRGVFSGDEVEALDRAFEEAASRKERKAFAQIPAAAASSRFNNFHQRSYDFVELEKKLFNQ